MPHYKTRQWGWNLMMPKSTIRIVKLTAFLLLLTALNASAGFTPIGNYFAGPKNEKEFPIVIKGKVLNEEGKPLANATVQVRGSKIGAKTDENGDFTLNIDGTEATLIVSFVGYATQEVKAENDMRIALVPQVKASDEVVVIGYGTQRKADLTGAIGQISRKDFANKPFTSADQILTGRLAGVNVTNRSGDPGAPIEVRIRGIGTAGNNQPLCYKYKHDNS
jgi:hypothetical protein